MDGDLLDLGLALGGEERGLGALGDDDDALALRVLLGEVGDVARDVLGGVGGERVRLGVRGRLGLVADDVVAVGDRGVQDVLEELGDEGSREVQDEGLVLRRRELAELLDGGGADWSVVSVQPKSLGLIFPASSDLAGGGRGGERGKKGLPVKW